MNRTSGSVNFPTPAPLIQDAPQGSASVPPSQKDSAADEDVTDLECDVPPVGKAASTEKGCAGLPISCPCDWLQCPSPERPSAIIIGGQVHHALQVNANGACSFHSLWGLPTQKPLRPDEIELFGDSIRSKLLQTVPRTWRFACSLHGDTMDPLLKALVDGIWTDVFALDSNSRDLESYQFESALPRDVHAAVLRYKIPEPFESDSGFLTDSAQLLTSAGVL